MRITRREFTTIATAALALPLGCGHSESDRDEKGRLILTLWHPWSGTRTAGMERMVRAYEKAHPHISLRTVFTPNDLASNQKFFTSVAAQRPPDVVFVDGPQVAEWAERGALMALDQRINSAGIRSSEFFEPCWKQAAYRDKVWALTYCADPNFAFAWNKADFRDAGLDPDHCPVTIDEMDQLSDKLLKLENGNIKRIGIIPWIQYAQTNSLFTWGWVFGGSFYDEVNKKITANHPKIVKALEWMCSYAKKYDITRITGLQQGFGAAQADPFYVGQVSMRCLHLSGIAEIDTYAPDLDYGLSFIPGKADGEMHSSWIGGWCLALPTGSKHPDEGFELIRWLCHSPEGTIVSAAELALLPGCKSSPAFESLSKRRGYDEFYRILKETKHQRPVMPVQAYYMGALLRAVDSATFGQKTPKRALDDATEETQSELDVVLKG